MDELYQSPFSSSLSTIALNSFKACSGSSSFFAIRGSEGTVMAKGNRHTLSRIIHIFDIRAFSLIAVSVIRVVEAVILINVWSANGDKSILCV